MTDKPPARPRQATLAGSLIMGGSALIVLLAFDLVAQNGSIEAREAAERFVSTSPGSGLGISVDGWLDAQRVLATIAGASAAAAAILGWQVLQRSRSARLALSVIGPVLLVTSLATADIAGPLVAAAIVMLWTPPTRDWFAGRATEPKSATRAVWPPPLLRAEHPRTSDAVTPPAPGAPDQNPAEKPYAPAEPHTYTAGQARPDDAAERPGAVLVASLLAIGSSAVTLLAMSLALAYALSSRGAYLDFVEEALADAQMPDGVAVADIADALVAFLVVVIVWCVAAIVLAVLTLRGSNVARITLVVSAGGAALASLLGILSIVALALTAAAVATMVLLLRGDVNRWYAARRRT